MLFNLHLAGRIKLATFVNRLLNHLGFSFAWINQAVDEVTHFFSITVKQRLKYNYLHNYLGNLHDSDKLCTYRNFKYL